MTRSIVVADASAIVAAVADAGPIGSEARERLRDRRRVAPFLVDAEVGRALRSMVLRGVIDEHAAVTARMLAERMIHRRHRHHGPLAERAWQFRHSLSYYGSLYLALAERLGCPVVTADRRIMRAQSDHELIEVIGIA